MGDEATDLESLSKQLVARFLARAKQTKGAARFVRLAMLVGGASVAGIAQFAEFDVGGPSAWQVAGILSTGLVAIGTIFATLTEQDASEELAIAHEAVENARAAEARYAILDRVDDEVERIVELYQIQSLSRGVIEQAISVPGLTEEKLVSSLMEACERSAAIALGFKQSDQWTIGIYRAEPQIGRPHALKCVAQHRAIKCSTENARVWEAGTGIVGAAFANRNEVVIEDLQAGGFRAVFGTAANESKPEDDERYRSMVAVPVLVDGIDQPWGVVTATNDRVDHFEPADAIGVFPAETVRALANMVALAIAMHRLKVQVEGR